MVDGDRIYPVDYHFLHHSTGPEFYNAEPIEVQDWFSLIGKARGYQNGALNPRHEHPSRPGQLTYAQAQFALYRYDKDGNKYGYKFIDLIKEPYKNVAWAVGNWFYNQRSVSTEVCGNFLNQVLPDKALMLLADYMRPIDQELGGALKVWLHQEVFATACPARIKEQRDKLVDMINRPDHWNAILWPPAPPKPVITTKDITSETDLPFASETIDDNTIPAGQTQLKQAGRVGKRTIIARITFSNGMEIKREIISDTKADPVNEIIARGTYVEPPKIEEPLPPIEEPKPAPPHSPRSTLWQKIVLAVINFIIARQANKKP